MRSFLDHDRPFQRPERPILQGPRRAQLGSWGAVDEAKETAWALIHLDWLQEESNGLGFGIWKVEGHLKVEEYCVQIEAV